MLEKIANINLKSEFFNKKKAAVAYKNSFKSGLLKNDLHDTVNLSPAYRFLSQIEWHLKVMTKVSAEKISKPYQNRILESGEDRAVLPKNFKLQMNQACADEKRSR